MICWKCKKEISIEKPVRSDECPLCHADLHVCKACEFYESGAHNDCRESSADMVTDKERANFCDYFFFIYLIITSIFFMISLGGFFLPRISI